MAACHELIDTLAREGRAPTKDELDGLRGAAGAVDMALFGRMLANHADANVDASVQVAHAISVNPVAVEEDYFTAVDDLNARDDEAGAGHIGEAGFGSGVFYLYLCVDRDLLRDNLKGDADLWARSLRSLTEAAATVAPSGKQNSFGSRARASYILVERGPQQPRSLSVAFLKAIRGGDPLDDAVLAIERQRDQFDRAYGACADDRDVLNVNAGEGSLGAILDFVEG